MYGRNLSHTNLGYRWIQGNEGFEMEKNSYGNNVWPQSDLYLMEQTMDQYLNQDHFNVYYVSVSGHMPYNFNGDAMAMRNKEIVADLTYSEETKAYIAANYELEKAMTYLVKRLEESGKAENTVIILSPDHIPYFDVDILEELSGKSFGGEGIEFLKEADIDYDIYSNSLIIWSASMKEPVQVDKICGQVDILPTISNLLGLEYDSRLLSGNDILSTTAPLVIFSSNSWLTDVGLYNRYTGKFTLAQGVSMAPEQIEEYVNIMKKVVKNKINASVLVIERDYYNTVFPNSTESQEESK
jgi:phosphoglycerol transferase MdoB-like AlkP superfamily enzyme